MKKERHIINKGHWDGKQPFTEFISEFVTELCEQDILLIDDDMEIIVSFTDYKRMVEMSMGITNIVPNINSKQGKVEYDEALPKGGNTMLFNFKVRYYKFLSPGTVLIVNTKFIDIMDDMIKQMAYYIENGKMIPSFEARL